ncbi:unnamed protein product [Oreochromis niloticus]|nr:unnamed protein product [Mustela putorius furo]
MGATDKTSPTEPSHKPKRRFSNNKSATVKLPKGLIGAKYTAQVKINDQACNCLLDTGSQVTTVSRSFFQADLEIHPIQDLLEVEAANGQNVPYSGYICVNITFPKNCFGTELTVSSLALIVLDTRSSVQSSLLIGTNTLDLVFESLSLADTDLSILPYGYRVVLSVLQQRHKQKEDDSLGLVTLSGKEPEVIPAGQSRVLEGLVHAKTEHSGRWVVVKTPSTSSLPGGVLVTNCLLTLAEKPSQKLPVVLRNESKHDIVIPAKSVIAEMHAIQEIIPNSQLTEQSKQTSSSNPAELNLNFADSPVPAEWKERITQKLSAMSEVFALHDTDFGCTNKVKHQIKLSDETPFKHRPRPVRPQDLDAVRRHLQELSDAGVIRESESPFSSPIVVVRKKNGDVRLCVDYRKLNLNTIRDAYALPNLEEAFSALTGSKWFSVLDLKSGYYQIEVDEADKHKTAFVCPMGFFEFNRMPQGITNAPSTFQRLMEKCMGDINLKEVLVYLDDLIVYSETLEQHETRLLHVLNRLKEYGPKLSPEKYATSYRWLSALSSFEFQLRYRAGKQNMDADGLSRRPHLEPLNDLVSLKEQERIRQFVQHHLPGTDPFTHVPTQAVSAICEKHLVLQSLDTDHALACPLVTSLSMSVDAVPDSFDRCDAFPVIPSLSEEELRQSQTNDPAISEIIHQLETGETSPPTVRNEIPQLSILLRELNKLELQNGILYRKRQVGR